MRRHPLIVAKVLIVLSLVAFISGCKSKPIYVSQRVDESQECFRGVPNLVYQPRRAIVTWQKPGETETLTTHHVCRIPVMYATDVNGACLGTTEANFTMQADGSMLKAEADVDQQVDEFISAVGDATEQIGGLGNSRGDETDVFGFMPSIDHDSAPEGYVLVDLQIMPLL